MIFTDFFHSHHLLSSLSIGKSSGSCFTPLMNSDAGSVYWVMLITSGSAGTGGGIGAGTGGIAGTGICNVVDSASGYIWV